MPSALRALGAAALTVTDNGTYLATVTLDSVPVKLLVDFQTAGVWVKCSALEGPSCADGITTTTYGYMKKRLERFDKNVPRKTTRFKEVVIADQVFNGFDGYVIYDPLRGVDTSIQGILGLRRMSADFEYASMYLDKQVTSVALQLGETSADSKLLLDTIDRAWLTKKGLSTALSGLSEMSCFYVPLPDGSKDCTYSAGSVTYDPALPYLGLYSTTLATFERRYLYTCTSFGSTYEKAGYTCDASVKLPRLTMQIGGWEFFLDPSEYTVPMKDSTQVKLLVGEYPFMYKGWVMGAPFLRKYPFMYNATSSSTLYCAENTTCTNVQPKTTYSPSYGGGYSGGGGTSGGGGPSYDIDVEVKRKRNKKYLAIGLSVGGVAILAICGCICKSCQSVDEEDKDTTAKDDASVQLAVVAVAVDSDSDGGAKMAKTSSSKDGAVSKPKPKDRKKQKEDVESSSSDDSDDSSSYDSESSEERRRERRRRRRRRRERRRERERRQQENSKATASAGDVTSEAPYVAAVSPRQHT